MMEFLEGISLKYGKSLDALLPSAQQVAVALRAQFGEIEPAAFFPLGGVSIQDNVAQFPEGKFSGIAIFRLKVFFFPGFRLLILRVCGVGVKRHPVAFPGGSTVPTPTPEVPKKSTHFRNLCRPRERLFVEVRCGGFLLELFQQAF